MRVGMMLAAAAAMVFGAGQASATITITIQEQPDYVLITASGKLNTAGLQYLGQTSGGGYINPSQTFFQSYGTGNLYTDNDPYFMSFGNGGSTIATSSSGDVFGVDGKTGGFLLPKGYTSGSSIAGTIRFDGATFASLGLVSNYSYGIGVGSGVNRDAVFVNVGNTPEPAAWAMFIFGFGAIGTSLRRNARRAGTRSILPVAG